MESQRQNPEFSNNPKKFHPCICSRHKKQTAFSGQKIMVGIRVKMSQAMAHRGQSSLQYATWL